MKKILNEFKEFINRGSVVDMAVGIMIGAAFKAIVDSLVNDLISPILGLFLKKDFSNVALNLFGVSIRIGSFFMAILNFFIIALVLFLIVKLMNSLSHLKHRGDAPAAPAAPTTKICPFCRSEIAIEATRCPHFTSELPVEEPENEAVPVQE